MRLRNRLEERQHSRWCGSFPLPPTCALSFCKECRAYAGNKARGLLEQREGKQAKTHVQRRCFEGGRDPRSNKLLGSAPWPLHERVPECWAAMASKPRGPAEQMEEEQLLAEEGLTMPQEVQEDLSEEEEGEALIGIVGAEPDDSSMSAGSEPVEEVEDRQVA